MPEPELGFQWGDQACFAVSRQHRPACAYTEPLSDCRLPEIGSALCVFHQCSDIWAVYLSSRWVWINLILVSPAAFLHVLATCGFRCVTEPAQCLLTQDEAFKSESK